MGNFTTKRIAKYVGINPKFKNKEHAKDHVKVILSQFGISKIPNCAAFMPIAYHC
jgi:hypothetical protein